LNTTEEEERREGQQRRRQASEARALKNVEAEHATRRNSHTLEREAIPAAKLSVIVLTDSNGNSEKSSGSDFVVDNDISMAGAYSFTGASSPLTRHAAVTPEASDRQKGGNARTS